MKRVLQVVYNMNDCGGIQSFIMNIYKHIDLKKVQFDFLLCEYSNSLYEKKIKELGGNIYIVPGRRNGIIKNKIELDKFFKKHKYDVVHYHSDSLSNIEPLIAAKNNGIETIIMHCHSTHVSGVLKPIYLLLHEINKKRIDKIATNYLACSNQAKKWAYDDNINGVVIKNCIDIEKFNRNEIEDNKFKKELGISDDAFVLCHTGRFEKVKNHEFILKVFLKIKERNDKAILLLVGDGKLYDEISQKVENMNLQSSVKLLGVREDVNKILRISDSFIYPSLYEGFGISLLEAEATGIPCVISDKVPSDVVINENVIQKSLDDGIEQWTECILNNNIKCNGLLNSDGYDIDSTVNELMKIYNQ